MQLCQARPTTTPPSSPPRARPPPPRCLPPCPLNNSLVQLKCNTLADVVEAQRRGQVQHKVRCTRMSNMSFRSHFVLTFFIERCSGSSEPDDASRQTRTCKLNVVDLAGSEGFPKANATFASAYVCTRVLACLRDCTTVDCSLGDDRHPDGRAEGRPQAGRWGAVKKK